MQIIPFLSSPIYLLPPVITGALLAAIALLHLYIVSSFQRIIDFSGTLEVSVFTKAVTPFLCTFCKCMCILRAEFKLETLAMS